MGAAWTLMSFHQRSLLLTFRPRVSIRARLSVSLLCAHTSAIHAAYHTSHDEIEVGRGTGTYRCSMVTRDSILGTSFISVGLCQVRACALKTTCPRLVHIFLDLPSFLADVTYIRLIKIDKDHRSPYAITAYVNDGEDMASKLGTFEDAGVPGSAPTSIVSLSHPGSPASV